MSDDLKLDMEALLAVFREETKELLDGIETDSASLGQRPDPEALKQLIRRFHTIAGACCSMGYESAGQLARTFERRLKPLREAGNAPSPALLGLCPRAAAEIRQLIAEPSRPADNARALEQQLEEVDHR